jgi:hypothetical protein
MVSPQAAGIASGLKHDPEKWTPVSHLHEACFGGRRKVGQDHVQLKNLGFDINA